MCSTNVPDKGDANPVQMAESAQSKAIVQLAAVYLVHQGTSAAAGDRLSFAVQAYPCRIVNNFFLSLLPELGTMGSKRGCALQSHEIQLPEMVTVAKPGQQPCTESCVVSGNGHCEA